MRLYKSSFRDASGRTRETSKWYVEFRDHVGQVRRLAAFKDKKASAELGNKAEDLASYRAARKDPAPLLSWIESLSPAIAEKFVAWGLLDRGHVAANKSLVDHLNDYKEHLLSCGRDHAHVKWTVSQIQKVIDGCGFKFWGEVNAHRVQTYVAGLRRGKLKARSRNGYYTAFKSFANWAVEKERIPYSPVATLQLLEITDERERRHMALDEFRWLLSVTASSADRFGMTGEERALLYRVAAETGLRASELKSLTRASFKLDGKEPIVTVQRGSTKNRKGAMLDLSAELTGKLQKWLETKMPAAPAFNMPDSTHTAEMLRQDMADARAAWIEEAKDAEDRQKREQSCFLAYVDDSGAVLVFHSLRHTRGVWLFEHHGAGPREVQELMRVSSIALVDRYTRSLRVAGRSIADRSPDLSPPQREEKRATGTDGAAVFPSQSGTSLGALLGATGRTSTQNLHSDALARPDAEGDEKVGILAENSDLAVKTVDWARKDSNLRRHKPSDLQSDPFGHFGTRPLRVAEF